MKQSESNCINFPLVTENDYGIRPAGPPDACLYCRSKIGEPHKRECVVITKRVKVRAIIEYEVDMPYSWDKQQIEFRYNEGGWCGSNITNEIEKYMKETESCLCFKELKVEYIETLDETPKIGRD